MASASPVTKGLQPEKFRLAAKTRLLELDMNITQLASELGLARNTVSLAINHPTMLPGVKERICQHLQF